jgi:hypothetical protein
VSLGERSGEAQKETAHQTKLSTSPTPYCESDNNTQTILNNMVLWQRWQQPGGAGDLQPCSPEFCHSVTIAKVVLFCCAIFRKKDPLATNPILSQFFQTMRQSMDLTSCNAELESLSNQIKTLSQQCEWTCSIVLCPQERFSTFAARCMFSSLSI